MTGPRPIDLPTAVPLDPDADLAVLDEAKILAAPDDPADRPAWRAALHRWRTEARARTAYDGSRYAEAPWAATAWGTAIVWLWDEAIRDWEHERFDVDRLVETYAPFGGLDAVVLWHAYPVIGIDERNQFDWYAVPGLAELVDDLHAHGIKVFLDYNPWDTGTRRTEATDAARLAELVTDLGADGVFLDTLKEGDPELLGTLGGLDPRPVLEGESRVPLARIGDHLASWAQWFADSPTPGVLRARWFEQRHLMHATRRWNRDHGDELRSAWVNGTGVLIWDVVFGVRVDWSPTDLATYRAMRAVYRDRTDLLLHGDWEPLTDLHPDATAAGIAGSRWSLGDRWLLTLAHTGPAAYDGPVVDGVHATVPPGGLLGVADGEVVLLEGGPPRPVVPPAPSRVVPVAGEERELTVTWRQRETGLYEVAPYVDDWKPLPPLLHHLRSETRTALVEDVVVDQAEVTDGEFAVFLAESGYRPLVTHRFLAHWVDGAPTDPDAPVRFVDLEDARAYAAWRGARLPTEDEWQVSAGWPGWTRREPRVWQWTESEHRDGRTRWVVLKGGSHVSVEGSEWYVDGGPQDDTWSLRYLLTQAGTSRCATIGFRCAEVRS